MGTTARVASGSITKGSSAEIIYPDEYSGSNTLRKYDQGVYVNDIDVMYGTTISKLRPNNDFHKIIDGKAWKGDLRPFDDEKVPSSFAFDPYQQRSTLKPFINGKPQAASSGSGTNAKPSDADDGWNHHWWYMQKSQIAISAGDGSRTYVSGANHVKASGLGIAPSHFRLDYDLGMTDIFQDATPFKDTANNDPVNIVTTDPLVIDYPINMVCQTDINLMDGVMEPFPLREVIDHSTLEVPFQSRGIRADMTLTDAFRRSAMMQYQVQSISSRTVTRDGRDFIKGCDPYLDGVEVFGLDLLDNFGVVTSSLEYNYTSAVSGKHPASDGSGPIYKSWWDHHKVQDLYNPDENKRTGPLFQPGYLYKPAATIPPFRDGTDREDVTALIKDETLTADGKYGILNFTFKTPRGKYTVPFLTSSFGVEARPQELVLHARLDKDGNFGDKPSLKSSTNFPSTFIMYQTGTLWSFSANDLDSSPYITDLDGRSLIPELSSNTLASGSLSPSAIVITSSHYAVNEPGAETYAPGGTVASHTGSWTGSGFVVPPSGSLLYHSPFSPTVPGTRVAYALGGYMGLKRPHLKHSSSVAPGPVITNLMGGRDADPNFPRQTVAAGWANAPTRPWAFGVWMRGDGETNYRIGTKDQSNYGGYNWANPDANHTGPTLSTYGEHAHIYLHTGYAQQRYQTPTGLNMNKLMSGTYVSGTVPGPDHTSAQADYPGGVIYRAYSGSYHLQDYSGTMAATHNFLGSSRHRQNQFYIEYIKEWKQATVHVTSFMHNSHGETEAWVDWKYHCSEYQNQAAYAAVTDGKWHHWAYAQHPNAGRNIYEHLTESASNRAKYGQDYVDGSSSAGIIWSFSSGSISGSNSQTWTDDDFNGFRVFCDGIQLTNGYHQGWKSAAKATGDKRDGKLWRCPTPTSDNATRSVGTALQNLDHFTKHQIDFIGALGHLPDDESRRLYPVAEPVFYVTPVTSCSGSASRLKGTGGSADVSGSLDPKVYPNATQGGTYPQTNGLPYTGWWIDNVWSGKTFRAISGLQSIKSLSSVSGETMKNALHDMNVQVPGHYTLDRDCVSPGRGIVYDNTEYGIDSLCFGGLKK